MFKRQQRIEIPAPVLTWKFGDKTGNVRAQNRYNTNEGYSLFNTEHGGYLTYVKTTFGINLGYINNNRDKKVHLRLPDRQEREVRTGELVAFGIGGDPSFLRYKERPVGINLEYAKEPAYEWRIFTASGEVGKTIAVGEMVALVNINVKPDPDFLIYFERPAGANIGWTTSPGWYQKLKSRFPIIDKAVKTASDLIKKL
jgi:hypothetical protein